MRYEDYRPNAPIGKIDLLLPDVVAEMAKLLSKTQQSLRHDTLKLPSPTQEELAGMLVDFAADVYTETGMWLGYERHNRRLFGTSLPVTNDTNVVNHPRGIGTDRIRHFLWVIYPELIDGLVLAPEHRDLSMVADVAAGFLRQCFTRLPRSSSIKNFLSGPHELGWDAKRKLVWLGTKSFMFRLPFSRYIAEKCDGDASIASADDFLCQECTCWSGLGAIDVLAGMLDVSDEDRRTLRGWYERHAAAYEVVSTEPDGIVVLNVYSGDRYSVRVDPELQAFKTGQLVLGSLVPWRGRWYWSGSQRAFEKSTPEMVEGLRADMKRRCPGILCRYWKDYEKRVMAGNARLHQQSLEYHGRDLVVYPDGASMAADWRKELSHHNRGKSEEHVAALVEKHGLKDGTPEVKLPDDILEEKNGIGVFLNPEEGKEIALGFNLIISALGRRGAGLSEDEERTVRGMILSEELSPRFVRRLAAEHGEQSFLAAFMMTDSREGCGLDYLLRRHKGRFYRKRYPNLAVV
jgi:hypothetical protein